MKSTLKVSPTSLENDRYKVAINADGDVASIWDKGLNKELLAAPIRMAFSKDTPKQYPAWNMDYEQEQAAPRNYVAGKPTVRVKENGPVRVSVEVTRAAEGSKFVQTISLSVGDAGNRVEFSNSIDWRSKDANLKVIFPLTASNPNATYNEDIGTIQRPNAAPRQFEVFSHRWIDLTDKSGGFGATILTDYKNASDKTADNIIRLTLLRTPGMLPENPGNYTDQANQDWGHHEITFGIMGHAAGWRDAQTDWQAYRMNDPLRAFATTKHSGPQGKSFSLLKLNTSRVRVLALKKAEDSDEIVLRMVELDGKPATDVRATFAAPVDAAREVNAQEQPLGSAEVHDGALVTTFAAYQPRTFALRLAASASKAPSIASQSVALKYDLATASNDDAKTTGGGMDGKGNAFPAEMLPAQLQMGSISFRLSPGGTASPNAVVAKGQTIQLPAGKFNRVYLLAASSAGDQSAEFRVGSKPVKLSIQDWGGFIGQWDTRLWKDNDHREWAISAHTPEWPTSDLKERELRVPSPRYPADYLGLRAGYIKPANVAWYASHFHTPQGLNQPYRFSYLFSYAIDLPANAHTLTLPNNEGIKVFAVSVANEATPLTPAQPLFDTLEHTSKPTTIEQASK